MSIQVFRGQIFIYTWSWVLLENLELNFSFLLDPLSISMSLLITFITSCVMIYSTKYLEEDPSIVRFKLFLHCLMYVCYNGNIW